MDFMNKLAIAIAVFLSAVILCWGSGFLGYAYGQDTGYAAGYEGGRGEGYTQGEKQGYQVGYKVGSESMVKSGGSSNASPHNPTYQEMKEFLSRDKTDSRKYVKEEYVCTDFSAAVNNNAETQGIRCAIVEIFYPKGYGHVIVAFDTVDRGLKFVEPQYDEEVNLVVGRSYSQVNKYAPPPEGHDDTVLRFLVIW